RRVRSALVASISVNRRRARVVQFFADAILGAPVLLPGDARRLHRFAKTAYLIQRAPPVAIRRHGTFRFERHAADFVGRRFEERLCPPLSYQQLSLPTREIEDVSLAAG